MKTDRMRWHLPETVDPPDTVCFQIEVPNDTYHLLAFYGAIYTLTYQKNWDRDISHTARAAAAVWMRIFESLRSGNCPTCPPLPTGMEIEDFMPLRIDCDCNVFVTCCDGTEKQILTADQVNDLLKQQPGDGTAQPTPGGGCQTYQGVMGAGAPWYLPTTVSTGDTLELQGAQGAWNDNTVATWNCPDGSIFFAGKCTGLKTFDGGDPVPSAAHMALIAVIAGVGYDLTMGPITVPGGISNEAVTLQANDSVLSGNPGSINFAIKVCNNQTASWSHTFNFATDAFGWAAYDTGGGNFFGTWNPGSGWDDSDASNSGLNARGVAITRSFPARNITGLVMHFDYTTGAVDSGAFVLQNVTDGVVNFIVHHLADVVAGTGVTDTSSVVGTGSTVIRLQYLSDITAGARSGNVRLLGLTLVGEGTDPF